MVLAMLAAGVNIGASGAARAAEVDTRAKNTRYEKTYSRGDWLRTWDDAKQYGAERVQDRARSMYQPDGIRMGNFFFFPSIGLETAYDNYKATPNADAYDNFRYDVVPVLAVKSSLPRHVIDFIMAGRFSKSDNEIWDERYEGSADARFRVDINHAHALFGQLHASKNYQDIRSVEALANASEPVPYDVYRGNVGLRRDAGRLAGQVEFTFEDRDYGDIRALDGSNIDQDFRDQQKSSGAINLIYRYSPGFAVLGGTAIHHLTNRGVGALDRDSTTYEAGLGLEWEFSPLLWGAIRGKYAWRDYHTESFSDFGATLVEAELQWLPTQLMTVNLKGARQMSETGFANASAKIDNSIGLRVDYEAMRNLVISVSGEYIQHEFVGTDRTDETFRYGAELQYFYTKNSSFDLSYEHEERTSSQIDGGLDFGVDTVRAGITLKY